VPAGGARREERPQPLDVLAARVPAHGDRRRRFGPRPPQGSGPRVRVRLDRVEVDDDGGPDALAGRRSVGEGGEGLGLAGHEVLDAGLQHRGVQPVLAAEVAVDERLGGLGVGGDGRDRHVAVRVPPEGRRRRGQDGLPAGVRVESLTGPVIAARHTNQSSEVSSVVVLSRTH